MTGLLPIPLAPRSHRPAHMPLTQRDAEPPLAGRKRLFDGGRIALQAATTPIRDERRVHVERAAANLARRCRPDLAVLSHHPAPHRTRHEAPEAHGAPR